MHKKSKTKCLLKYKLFIEQKVKKTISSNLKRKKNKRKYSLKNDIEKRELTKFAGRHQQMRKIPHDVFCPKASESVPDEVDTPSLYLYLNHSP